MEISKANWLAVEKTVERPRPIPRVMSTRLFNPYNHQGLEKQIICQCLLRKTVWPVKSQIFFEMFRNLAKPARGQVSRQKHYAKAREIYFWQLTSSNNSQFICFLFSNRAESKNSPLYFKSPFNRR